MATINSVLGPMDTAGPRVYAVARACAGYICGDTADIPGRFIDRAGTIERGIRDLKAAYDEGPAEHHRCNDD